MATVQEYKWNTFAGALSSGRDRTERNKLRYIAKSLERLCVMADVPMTRSKTVVCRLIREYGGCLPDEQRECLERWCSD